MVTAISGFITNFETVKFNFMVLRRAEMAITNATKWHATDPHAAPLIPISGIGTNTKLQISLTKTPTP